MYVIDKIYWMKSGRYWSQIMSILTEVKPSVQYFLKLNKIIFILLNGSRALKAYERHSIMRMSLGAWRAQQTPLYFQEVERPNLAKLACGWCLTCLNLSCLLVGDIFQNIPYGQSSAKSFGNLVIRSFQHSVVFNICHKHTHTHTQHQDLLLRRQTLFIISPY